MVNGGSNGKPRPLDGVKVLDLTWFGAGPIGTRALANLGADVVRVETEKRPDGLRIGGPRPPGTTNLNLSGYYNNFNAEKRSVTIDLTTERGHELGIELVRWADIFVTNMTNRAVGQIGLTWETVSAANPGIIGLYQPMQGLTGPHAEFIGFGAVLSTVCGVNGMTGFDGSEPRGSGSNYPDYVVNPIHLAIGVMAALRHKRRTGEGQLIDMAQLESSVTAMAGPVFAIDNGGPEYRRAGNRVTFAAPHGAYGVQGDDRWLVLACSDEAQWRAFMQVSGHPEWADDARFADLDARKANEDALDALVGEWAAEQDGTEAMQRLQAADVPAGIVQTASEVLADDHIKAREYFAYPEHAEAGVRAYDGPGFRLSATPHEVRGPAPLLGEHTFEICKQILQLSDDEIADLVAEQVLF
ncbi:MAG TPA: CoA transferase [Dehalococcoidia bacterium]|jgi:benzylsuccinate CoA-transferase BbsF subunit|nr:CoA transferase [Dehalococcoidia bacterium]